MSIYIVSTMANDAFKGTRSPDPAGHRRGGSAVAPRRSARPTRDLGVSKPTISRHLKLLEEAGVGTAGDRRADASTGPAARSACRYFRL